VRRVPFFGSRPHTALPTIQHGAITQDLHNALGIHGSSIAPSLGDVIHPVIVVKDLSVDSWYASGQSDKPCSAGGTLVAAAGNMPFVQLFNPHRDLVVIVDYVMVSCTTNQQVNLFGITSPGTLSPQSPAHRDFRSAGQPGCQLFLDTPVVAAPPTNQLAIVGAPVAGATQCPIRFVFGFNQGLGLTIAVAAATLNWHISWREHAVLSP
jgi:hypothetical protein